MSEHHTEPLLPPSSAPYYEALRAMPDSELALAWQTGEQAAGGQLLRRHMGKMAVEAGRIAMILPRQTGLDFEDLLQDTGEQLLLAAQRFDPEKQAGHDSLLVMMKNGPYKTVETNAWQSFSVRPSDKANDLSRKLWHFDRETYAKHQRPATNDEASKRLGVPVFAGRYSQHNSITVQDVRAVRKLTLEMQNYGTINDLNNNSSVHWQELSTQFAVLKAMTRDPAPNPEELALENDARQQVRAFVERLDNHSVHEREIITMRYGLGGKLPLDIRAIAAELGIQFDRVRQLEQSAMNRLRYWMLAERRADEA